MKFKNLFKNLKEHAPLILTTSRIVSNVVFHGKEAPIFNKIDNGFEIADKALELTELIKGMKK